MTSILNRFNNLTQRIIAAVIGAPILLFLIIYSPYTYFAIFFILTLLTQMEFYNLVRLHGILPLRFLGCFIGAIIFCLTFFVETGEIDGKYAFLIFPLLATIFFIKLYKKNEKNPFTNIGFTFLGIIYVAVPFALLNFIAFSRGEYHWEIIVGLLLILWASDTGAYFAGVNFGKTKLFERVSPKKSWEGSVGGALTSLAMAYGLSMFFTVLPLWEWLSVSVIIIVAGTYGDLVESLFKRSMEIKDSGKSIPGHGGFLDRFDGLLLSVPFIIVFLRLL
jgi:phosphatidate cytidylyltransferase